MAKSDFQTLGVSGEYNTNTLYGRQDFIPALRGTQAVKTFRQMRDNDPIIGAILTAMDMVLRSVEWRVEPAEGSPQATEAAEFLEGVVDDMDHTWEDFISDTLSFLPFGFAVQEMVFKRRMGPNQKRLDRRSAYDDGRIGIRKIASRAQWTIEQFISNEDGELEYVVQNAAQQMGGVKIPMDKVMLFRTTSVNNDPFGRSVLRNAYLSWYYVERLDSIEAIAVERELNGLPVGRIPNEYMASDAPADKKALKTRIEKILRDLRRNEQSYLLLPSDMMMDDEGKLTNQRLVDVELMASNGTRDIDVGKAIMRHQNNMARSVLADFLMLGQSERGSFALSKSKTDLFLQAITAYLNSIAAIINRKMVVRLWALNGFDATLMPTMVPGNVAPVDLEELANFVEKLAGSGATLFPDEDLENHLRSKADLPESSVDPDLLAEPELPDVG